MALTRMEFDKLPGLVKLSLVATAHAIATNMPDVEHAQITLDHVGQENAPILDVIRKDANGA